MEVKFHRALLIGGKFFGLGVHEVPDSIVSHPHFEKYMKIDWITDPSALAPEQETLEERNQRLAEKLAASPEAKSVSMASELSGDGDEPQDDSDSEAKDSKQKKKKR